MGESLQKEWGIGDSTLARVFRRVCEVINANRKIVVESQDGLVLKCKTLDIGDWDMDTDSSVSVAHGLPDFTKIRSISVLIRADDNAAYHNLESYLFTAAEAVDQRTHADATNIVLNMDVGGRFDTADFNATSFNRGWKWCGT